MSEGHSFRHKVKVARLKKTNPKGKTKISLRKPPLKRFVPDF